MLGIIGWMIAGLLLVLLLAATDSNRRLKRLEDRTKLLFDHVLPNLN